ncbi:MAG: DUF853 family protein, partial [Sandarakinorhabdus sp.]|nr:DUF853 family protein [Sandarakinorhabdus sp.]
VRTVITELKVGEALVSLLMADGAPSPVERTLIAPPRSRVGPVTPDERATIVNASLYGGKYDDGVDRESAWELLNSRAAETAAKTETEKVAALKAKLDASAAAAAEKQAAAAAKAAAAAAKVAARPQPKSFAEKMIESTARSAATSVGRQLAGKFGGQLLRGLLGGLLK